MDSLESELRKARELPVSELADAIESIGFECTRCGACCKGHPPETEASHAGGGDGSRERNEDATDRGTAAKDDRSTTDRNDQGDPDPNDRDDREPHTATVFPDEVRRLQGTGDYDWRDVARPMPYGLEPGPDGPRGETFEWALQTDGCGDCRFYEQRDGTGACTVHGDRPLICRTYPFSVALGGTSQPMGEAVDEEGIVRAHECEGLGRSIDREDAETMARALKERAVRELREAIAVRDNYEPVEGEPVVVYDSEGPKRADGTPIDE